MAEQDPIVEWALYDDAGAPLEGESPTVIVYRNRDGFDQGVPTVVEIGGGGYGFVPSTANLVSGVVFMIDNGASVNPRYMVGAASKDGDLFAFGLFDAASAPKSDAAPTFATFKSIPSGDLAPPGLTNYGDGIYGFFVDGGTLLERPFYEIDSGSGAFPERVSGTAEYDPAYAGDLRTPSVYFFGDAQPGTTIVPGTPLEPVVDATSVPNVVKVVIMISYAGLDVVEVAYDGEGFTPLYADESLMSEFGTFGGSRAMSLIRRGGWPAAPRMQIVALTSSGAYIGADTSYFWLLSGNTAITPVRTVDGTTAPSVGRDWLIDPDTREYVLRNGDYVLARDAEAIRQDVDMHLNFVLGEHFLDEEAGVPFLERILVKSPDIADVRSVLRQQILKVEGVVSVTELLVDFDGSTRTLTVNWRAETDVGLINGPTTLLLRSAS
jgi:hypothetical protein